MGSVITAPCAPKPTRRFPTNQTIALHVRALLNEEAPEVNLMLASY